MTAKRISTPALRQIEKIYEYIARDSPQAASDVVGRIHRTIDLLVENPRMGHQTVRRNARMFAVDGYPYLIYFQYLPRLDELRVVAVRHAARRRLIELREGTQEFRVPIS